MTPFIEYPSLLLPAQTAYFTKLSNLPEWKAHLHLYNGLRIIPPWKTPQWKAPHWRTFPLKFRHFQIPPQKIFLWVLMRTQFFTAVFPAINHWSGETVVETGDEFYIIYIFITIFVNRVYSKFNNFSNFVFHCQKKEKEKGIKRSVFHFTNVKKRNKIYRVHIFF